MQMSNNNWQSDELGQFPSAASPLTAMGIDPDEARANPELMARLTVNPSAAKERLAAGPGAINRVGDPRPNGAPPPHVTATRQTGGASAVPNDPTDAGNTFTPSAPSVPATGAPTDPYGYGMEGLGTLSKAAKSSSQAAEDIQTQTPQEITDLQSQREKLATPAPRFDPSTGKGLPKTQEYDPQTGQMVDIDPKASTGQKIWRGLRSAGIGLVETFRLTKHQMASTLSIATGSQHSTRMATRLFTRRKMQRSTTSRKTEPRSLT